MVSGFAQQPFNPWATKPAALFSTIFQAARRARSLASAFAVTSRSMMMSISSPVRMPRSMSALTRAWTISMLLGSTPPPRLHNMQSGQQPMRRPNFIGPGFADGTGRLQRVVAPPANSSLGIQQPWIRAFQAWAGRAGDCRFRRSPLERRKACVVALWARTREVEEKTETFADEISVRISPVHAQKRRGGSRTRVHRLHDRDRPRG